jgi:hypothetical protein
MKTKITLLMMSAILFTTNVKAQFIGYSYAKSITVTNTSSVSAINYQLRLTVNTQSLIAASQMQVNGNDIRFGKKCSASATYNHWIESGINTATTVIWVKVDTILAGSSKTFFMYHGNPTAVSTSSIPGVFINAGSATDSVAVGGPGGSAGSQRGFKFSPNVDILVTSLGKREPIGSVRYVTLFDNSSTAILAQQQVSGPLGSYSYTTLPNPIWLSQGSQYIIQLYQGVGDTYYFGSSTQIDSRLTFYDMRYCNSCTQNTFPTSSLTSGMHYGNADFLFFFKNTITPTPSYTINAVNLPIVTATSSNSLICVGTTVTLTATGATTYSWSSGSLGSVTLVTPTTTTTYTVIGTNTANCSSNATITQSVSICTSLNSLLQNDLNYSIYPNPTSGIINIDLENKNNRLIKIELLNAIGQVIMTETSESNRFTFNLQNYPAGIYFVKLIEQNRVIALEKIIKD